MNGSHDRRNARRREVLSAVLAVNAWLAAVACGAAPKATAPTGPTGQIQAEPGHAMIVPGGTVEIRFRVLDQQGKASSGALEARIAQQPATSIALGPDGCGRWTFQAATDTEPGIQEIEFRQSASRASLKYYVDLVDRPTHDAFQAAAAKVRFDKLPAHLLFIGDSLTDGRRGQNYVDKIAFWLGRQSPVRATVKNAGVGGDTITRVWQRMCKEPGAYRQSMYDDLFVPKPGLVFFFLGHNDSKLASTSEYRDPFVAPGDFQRQYGLAIRKVQEQTGARIIVLSATSSVWEITRAAAEKRRAAGKAHNLFGKPEALEQFNALARKAAGQCGAEYLDVYAPTRSHPDKPGLFTTDGVHVNNLGNRLLALEVLKYLGAVGR